jgi:preprotein translocase subunit Sec61beta
MAGSAPRKASFAEVAKAVLWSFFGVRKKKDYERDSVSISPVQVIVAGLIGAALFVLALVMVVKLVTS